MILLRHTRPEIAEGVCYGATDLPLAATFETEAAAVLARLPAVSAVLSSPLSRCRRLAERIAAARGLAVAVVPDWREMDFGAWEGRRWDAIPRAALDGWAADFADYRGHGGESVAALQARVRRALAATPDGAVVVTHAGCVKAALAERGQGAGWDARLGFGDFLRL